MELDTDVQIIIDSSADDVSEKPDRGQDDYKPAYRRKRALSAAEESAQSASSDVEDDSGYWPLWDAEVWKVQPKLQIATLHNMDALTLYVAVVDPEIFYWSYEAAKEAGIVEAVFNTYVLASLVLGGSVPTESECMRHIRGYKRDLIAKYSKTVTNFLRSLEGEKPGLGRRSFLPKGARVDRHATRLKRAYHEQYFKVGMSLADSFDEYCGAIVLLPFKGGFRRFPDLTKKKLLPSATPEKPEGANVVTRGVSWASSVLGSGWNAVRSFVVTENGDVQLQDQPLTRMQRFRAWLSSDWNNPFNVAADSSWTEFLTRPLLYTSWTDKWRRALLHQQALADLDYGKITMAIAAVTAAATLYWSRKIKKNESMSYAGFVTHFSRFFQKAQPILAGLGVVVAAYNAQNILQTLNSVFRIQNWFDRNIDVKEVNLDIENPTYIPYELVKGALAGSDQSITFDLDDVTEGPLTRFFSAASESELDRHFPRHSAEAIWPTDVLKHRRNWCIYRAWEVQESEDFQEKLYSYPVWRVTPLYDPPMYVQARTKKHAKYLYMTYGYCTENPDLLDVLNFTLVRLMDAATADLLSLWPLFAVALSLWLGYISAKRLMKKGNAAQKEKNEIIEAGSVEEHEEPELEISDPVAKYLFLTWEEEAGGKTKGQRMKAQARLREIEEFVEKHGIKGANEEQIANAMKNHRDALRAALADFEEGEYYDVMSYGNAGQKAAADAHLRDLRGQLRNIEVLVEEVYNGKYSTSHVRRAGKGKNKFREFFFGEEDEANYLDGCYQWFQYERDAPRPWRKFDREARPLPKVQPRDYRRRMKKESATQVPQIDTALIKASVVPIYYGDRDKPCVNLFMTKLSVEGKTWWYTKKHGTEVPECFVRYYDAQQIAQFISINWKEWEETQLDTIRIPAAKIAVPRCHALKGVESTKEKYMTFYTFNVKNPKSVQVVSGPVSYNAKTYEYSHRLSTYAGQCGCPYVDQSGAVFALHAGTDSSSQINYGHPLITRKIEGREIVNRKIQSAYDPTIPSVRDYKALHYLGRSPFSPQRVPLEPTLIRYNSLFHETTPEFVPLIQELTPQSYYASSVNEIAINVSEMKMDEVREFNPRAREWDHVQRMLDKQMALKLSTPSFQISDVPEIIDMTKGPGYPWSHYGYKTRTDLWNVPEFQLYLGNPTSVPIYKSTPKTDEWLTEKEITQDFKVRTFIIPPLELLTHQIAMGYGVSQAIKGWWWSAYGFNPFSGGVHRMARRLLSKPYRFMWDWKGWDRKVRLHTTYIRKVKYSDYPWKEFVAQNTARSVIKMHNGDVVGRDDGNCSGTGTTTQDNILAGMEALEYILVCAYVDEFKELPRPAYIEEQIAYIFGDDLIAAVDGWFGKYIGDTVWLTARAKELQLEVKEFVGGLELPLEKLKFLGFTFVPIGDLYFPRWDMDRLSTSVLYERDSREDMEQYLSKLFSITILSLANQNLFVVLLKAYELTLRDLSDGRPLSAPLQAAVSAGPLTTAEVIAFYAGWERHVPVRHRALFQSFIGRWFCFFDQQVEEDQNKMTTLSIFAPTFSVTPEGIHKCSSLIQGVEVQTIVGYGSTPMAAFEDYESQLDEPISHTVNSWIPPEFEGWYQKRVIPLLHGRKFMEGSFNPWGNGMILSKQQYELKYAGRLKGKNPQERAAIYQSYKTYMEGRKAKRAPKPKMAPPPRRAPRTRPVPMGPTRAQNLSEMGAARPKVTSRRPNNNLSPCARKYAAAVVNPFSMVDGSELTKNASINGGAAFDPSDACIPTFPPLKSRRLKIFTTGVFNAGTNGNGAIVIAPRRIANNYTGNDYHPPIFATNPTATLVPGQAFPGVDSGGALSGGLTAFQWNSDYTLANLATVNGRGIEYRVVACGLRIRYTGPELNRGGTIWGLEEPSHDSLTGLSYSTLGNYESAFKMSVTRSWSTLTYTPVLQAELNYYVDIFANGLGDVNLGFQHSMGFAVQGATASAPFEFEAICLLEVIGATVRDQKPAEADLTGLSQVMNVVAPSTQKALNDGGQETIFKTILENKDTITSTATLVADVVKAVM